MRADENYLLVRYLMYILGLNTSTLLFAASGSVCARWWNQTAKGSAKLEA